MVETDFFIFIFTNGYSSEFFVFSCFILLLNMSPFQIIESQSQLQASPTLLMVHAWMVE